MSLVESLKSMIERTYGIPPVIPDLGPYIIGDDGYRRFYGACRQSGDRPLTLVRDAGGAVRASVYYPDALVRHLERFNPVAALGDVNIDAFAALVEEIDHLLLVAHRAAERRPVSLLELEHHAAVTKYLVVVHFLARQLRRRRLPEPLRVWARHHLFERYAEDAGATRYRDAARWAGRYVGWLERLTLEARRAELRDFQRRPLADTQRLLARIH